MVYMSHGREVHVFVKEANYSKEGGQRETKKRKHPAICSCSMKVYQLVSLLEEW